MQDTNLNIAKCLKEATDFGVTHVHNICSGTITDVPWGSMDYLGVLALVAIAVGMMTFLGGITYAILRDI